MKTFKFLTLVLISFIIMNINFSSNALAETKPPEVEGAGVILMEATTGEILFNKDMDKPLPPASTTKILTALITLEKTSLNEKVLIGKTPPNADGTSLGLVEGEYVTVESLLNALLIGSCNDAAVALAEHISGSVEEFSKLMNTRAKELGATNSNFVNPNGLYDKNHYTSAHDLALIMREAIKHPEFLEISQKPFYVFKGTNKYDKDRWVNNRVSLLFEKSPLYYKEYIAGKTGYTVDAKHSFVSAAKKGDLTLISAIVHTDDKNEYFKDSIDLFNYGFDNFTLTKLINKGDTLGNENIANTSIPLISKNDFYYVKNKNLNEPPKIDINSKDLKNIKFVKNDEISEATISLNNKVLGKVPLISGEDKPKTIMSISNNKHSNRFYIILGSIFLLILLT
ncbi:D-alanyl-D-alanine carboxypeptidase family protein, partial [Clostridium sp.]|uniref:D-alanyl-D-alanine carboxypeptidase family protein n=1 Tax=Clostridium sp. TaxID=1506 RepID=UPI003464A83D